MQMASFGEKVSLRREALGLSLPALGKATGLSYQAIQQIEDGTSKTSRKLLDLAKALQVPADWLMSDDDTPPPPLPAGVAATSELSIQQMPRDLEVLGGALCGEDGLFEFNGTVLDHVRRPPRLMSVKGAYAVYVDGECMSPWREHGDLVYVHPHVPVKIADYVVVQLHPQSDGGPRPAYIKRLVRRTSTSLHLLQYNPRKELQIPAKRVGAIHKIIDWSELMSI